MYIIKKYNPLGELELQIEIYVQQELNIWNPNWTKALLMLKGHDGQETKLVIIVNTMELKWLQ